MAENELTHTRYRVTHIQDARRKVHSHHGDNLEGARRARAAIPSGEEPEVEMGVEPWDTGSESCTVWSTWTPPACEG